MSDTSVSHDAIVLVGGGGARLGGVDKAAVDLDGRPLLDASIRAARDARTLVVVGRTAAPVPERAVRASEDPPGGGPAAGFLAGLAAVVEPAPWTLLLACDVPGAPAATAHLLAQELDDASRDGVVLTDPDGQAQWVLGLYRTAALQERLAGSTAGTNRSLRALLTGLHLGFVTPRADEWHDVDTWADHEAWQARLLGSPRHEGIMEP